MVKLLGIHSTSNCSTTVELLSKHYVNSANSMYGDHPQWAYSPIGRVSKLTVLVHETYDNTTDTYIWSTLQRQYPHRTSISINKF